MASVQTSSYDGRYLKLTVYEESYRIANNTSTVRWTLESIGGSANYYTIYNWGVWVNGQQIYGTQTTYWNSYNFPTDIRFIRLRDDPFVPIDRAFTVGVDTVIGYASKSGMPRALSIEEIVNTYIDKIVDIEMSCLDGIENKVDNTHGYSLSGFDLVFKGLCPDCMAKGGKDNG